MKTTYILAVATLVVAAFTADPSIVRAGTPVPPPTGGQQINTAVTVTPGIKKYTAPIIQNKYHASMVVMGAPYAGIQVTASPYLSYTMAVVGPDRGSTNFVPWATAMVSNLYSGGFIFAMSNAWTHGYRLLPSDLSQSPDLTNYTIWFLNQTLGVNSSIKFTPADQSFVERSSDPSNSLEKTNDFSSDPNYAYNPWWIGVTWGSGGPRSSDKIYNDPAMGPWKDIPVNETISIMAQSTYYVASTNDVANYINSFTFTNFGFGIVGAVYTKYATGGSNALATAQVTLQTMGAPIPPVITIVGGPSAAATNVILGVNMDAGRTIILRYWTPINNNGQYGKLDIATLNAGEYVNWPTLSSLATFVQGYYRAQEEQ